MNRLRVIHKDNATHIHYDSELENYVDGLTATMALHQSEDYLYVGYTKPIHSLYIELTAGGSAGTLGGEYYNGSWTSMVKLVDRTSNFLRSGFIDWETQTGEVKTAIDSTEAYWYRFQPSVTHASTVIKGISIVFSNDLDLKEEVYNIASFYQTNSSNETETSLIRLHQAARNEITQMVNNKGYDVNNGDTYILADYWTIMDRNEVKQASKYLVLSKMFSEMSDRIDDVWQQKGTYYYSLFSKAFNLFRFTIDTDNDGIIDKDEKQAIDFVRIRRV